MKVHSPHNIQAVDHTIANKIDGDGLERRLPLLAHDTLMIDDVFAHNDPVEHFCLQVRQFSKPLLVICSNVGLADLRWPARVP
jgi:hypothetical protein